MLLNVVTQQCKLGLVNLLVAIYEKNVSLSSTLTSCAQCPIFPLRHRYYNLAAVFLFFSPGTTRKHVIKENHVIFYLATSLCMLPIFIFEFMQGNTFKCPVTNQLCNNTCSKTLNIPFYVVEYVCYS